MKPGVDLEVPRLDANRPLKIAVRTVERRVIAMMSASTTALSTAASAGTRALASAAVTIGSGGVTGMRIMG
jgi:hypothetical protein